MSVRLLPAALTAAIAAAAVLVPVSAQAADTGAPVVTGVTTSADAVTVTWSAAASPDVEYYSVGVQDPASVGSGAYQTTAEVDGGALSATIDRSSLVGGSSYLVTVTADLADFSTVTSDPSPLTLAENAPPAPDAPDVARKGASRLTISVPAYEPDTDVSSYTVTKREVVLYRDGKASKTIPVAPAGATRATVAVAAGHSYRAADRVVTAAGTSPLSSKSFAVAVPIAGPGKARHLDLHTTDTGYRITWKAASRAGHSKIVGYRVTVERDGKKLGTRTVKAGARSVFIAKKPKSGAVGVSVVAINTAGGTSTATGQWFSFIGGFGGGFGR